MKQALMILQILFFGLLVGPALLMAVAYFLHQTGGFTPVLLEMDEILLMAMLVFSVGSFVVSRALFEKQASIARNKADVSDKLDVYRTASILRYALLEAPAFMAAVLFLLTGSISLLLVGFGILLYMVTLRPSQDGLMMDLGLSLGDL